MKLTQSQKESLVANAKLYQVIQNELVELERNMFANQPTQLAEGSTEQEIEAFNNEVDAWVNSKKIEDFNRKYYHVIADAKSREKRIFVNSLADFNYEGIEGLKADELVDVIAATQFKETTVIKHLINEMFNKVMFPPQKIVVKPVQ